MSAQWQIELLNRAVGVMHTSTRREYSSMQCVFDHECYEGGWSVGSRYSYSAAGEDICVYLDDPRDAVSDFVHELHELMREHTGGDWKSLVVTVDGRGDAATKISC